MECSPGERDRVVGREIVRRVIRAQPVKKRKEVGGGQAPWPMIKVIVAKVSRFSVSCVI